MTKPAKSVDRYGREIRVGDRVAVQVVDTENKVETRVFVATSYRNRDWWHGYDEEAHISWSCSPEFLETNGEVLDAAPVTVVASGAGKGGGKGGAWTPERPAPAPPDAGPIVDETGRALCVGAIVTVTIGGHDHTYYVAFRDVERGRWRFQSATHDDWSIAVADADLLPGGAMYHASGRFRWRIGADDGGAAEATGGCAPVVAATVDPEAQLSAWHAQLAGLAREALGIRLVTDWGYRAGERLLWAEWSVPGTALKLHVWEGPTAVDESRAIILQWKIAMGARALARLRLP